jgi:hypothetical protein
VNSKITGVSRFVSHRATSSVFYFSFFRSLIAGLPVSSTFHTIRSKRCRHISSKSPGLFLFHRSGQKENLQRCRSHAPSRGRRPPVPLRPPQHPSPSPAAVEWAAGCSPSRPRRLVCRVPARRLALLSLAPDLGAKTTGETLAATPTHSAHAPPQFLDAHSGTARHVGDGAPVIWIGFLSTI